MQKMMLFLSLVIVIFIPFHLQRKKIQSDFERNKRLFMTLWISFFLKNNFEIKDFFQLQN